MYWTGIRNENGDSTNWIKQFFFLINEFNFLLFLMLLKTHGKQIVTTNVYRPYNSKIFKINTN